MTRSNFSSALPPVRGVDSWSSGSNQAAGFGPRSRKHAEHAEMSPD